MPEVLIYHRTWNDPDWHRDRNRLPADQKSFIDESLASLYQALLHCRYPRDRELQEWSPSKYSVSSVRAKWGEWIKYRLGDRDNRARVVIVFRSKENRIYLIARTLPHDSAHLKGLTGGRKFPRARITYRRVKELRPAGAGNFKLG